MPSNSYSSKRIRLRAHHLICLLGFVGKGYNREFIDNMQAIKNSVGSSRISIVDSYDDICDKCPEKNGKCSGNFSSAGKDAMVIKKLELDKNESQSFSNLQKKIANNFKVSDLDIICKDCEWLPLGHCKEGINNLKVQSGTI